MSKDSLCLDNLDAFSHLKELQKELFLSTKDKHIVYLDMNYWNDFVDLQKGLKVSPPYIAELYELLTHLVDDGKVLVPVCDIHLYESYKNKNEYSYKSLVSLMEKLSQNKCFISAEQRWNNELLQCIRVCFQIENASELFRAELWTAPFFLKGDRIPFLEGLSFKDQKEKVQAQKKFIDDFFCKSLTDIFSKGNRAKLNPKEFERIAIQRLIEGREKHKNSYGSFEKLLEIEMFGTMGLSKNHVDDLLVKFYQGYSKGSSVVADTFYHVSEEERCHRLLFLIVKSILKSEQYNIFPSLTISSYLHSLKRWEISSKYKETDLFDIMHAQVALPYGDYFFTDRNLCALTKDKHIKLDKKFNCKVIAKPKEAYRTLLDSKYR